MRYFLGLLSIVFIISCIDSEKQPTRKFDYSRFNRHELKELHIDFKLPKDFEHVVFDQEALDSLMEESNNQSFSRQRRFMISILFSQKQGKLEMYIDNKNLRHFTVASFPHTAINKELVKQMGHGLKAEIERSNTEYENDMKLTEVLMGNAGKVTYALFKTESSYGNIYSFIVTLGLRSWRMYYLGDNDFDYEAVLNSIKFPK
jgi:hypothetical protein